MKNSPAGKQGKLLYADHAQGNIAGLLRELLHAFLELSVPAWLDLQLTLPQLRTLFIVAHNKTSSVMRIAKQLGVGEPTASHLVDRLVQAGLIERGEDPADRRRAVVRLSGEGEELIEKLLGWEKSLGGCLHKVSDEDLSRFRCVLHMIINEVRGYQVTDR